MTKLIDLTSLGIVKFSLDPKLVILVKSNLVENQVEGVKSRVRWRFSRFFPWKIQPDLDELSIK